MEHHGFLADLALVMCVAAVTTVVCHRLRQPAMLGYILAGLIIGPHIPIPLVANAETVTTLSELGVVLLMFSLGLEFSLARLTRVASTAGLIALVEVSLTFSLGYGAGRLLGWGATTCVFVGGIVSISSTTVVARLFAERGIRGGMADTAFGILICEDLVAILLLAALTTFASAGSVSAGLLAGTAGDLAAFLVVLLVVGLFVVPRSFRGLLRLQNPETLLVASVGLCFAAALLASQAGFSVALGAFLAGVLIAESEAAHRVDVLVRPLRDMFGAIFFVAVGMSIDPKLIMTHWPAVLVLAGIVVTGKILGVGLGAFLVGLPPGIAVQAGMSLAQIGEFSFVMAGLAAAAGGEGKSLPAVAVAVSALTTFTTPWLIAASPRAAEALDRRLPRPLQTLIALYGTWLEHLGAAWRAAASRTAPLRSARLVALDAILLALVAGGGTVLVERLGTAGRAAGLPSWLTGGGLVAIMIAVGIVLAVGLVRSARGLARDLAAFVFPAAPADTADASRAPRDALGIVLLLLITLGTGLFLIAVLQPFVPVLPLALLLLGLLATLSLSLWRKAEDLEGHARAGAEALLELVRSQRHAPGRPDAVHDAAPDAPPLVPGFGRVLPVVVEPGYPADGRTLAELGLRARTGATIVAIKRGAERIVFPTGKARPQPGDVLLVTGTEEALAEAQRLLTASSILPGEGGPPV